MKSKIKVIVVIILFSTLFVGNFAQAAIVECAAGPDNCQLSDLLLIVIRVINYLFFLASFLAMAFIVWAGYNMVTAGGNEEKITGAKTVLNHAIVGFFLILVSFLLIDAIVALLGGFTLEELFRFAKDIPF